MSSGSAPRFQELEQNHVQNRSSFGGKGAVESDNNQYSPGQVREVRVCGGGNDLTANRTEFLCPLAESHNLSGADEGEVQWIEEKDHIFPWITQMSWQIFIVDNLLVITYVVVFLFLSLLLTVNFMSTIN